MTEYEKTEQAYKNGYAKGFEDGKPKWIPVKERLPDANIPSGNYLCFWNGNIRVCKYWRTRKEFVLYGRVMKVTHWMPLPDAPKEG